MIVEFFDEDEVKVLECILKLVVVEIIYIVIRNVCSVVVFDECLGNSGVWLDVRNACLNLYIS